MRTECGQRAFSLRAIAGYRPFAEYTVHDLLTSKGKAGLGIRQGVAGLVHVARCRGIRIPQAPRSVR